MPPWFHRLCTIASYRTAGFMCEYLNSKNIISEATRNIYLFCTLATDVATIESYNNYGKSHVTLSHLRSKKTESICITCSTLTTVWEYSNEK